MWLTLALLPSYALRRQSLLSLAFMVCKTTILRLSFVFPFKVGCFCGVGDEIQVSSVPLLLGRPPAPFSRVGIHNVCPRIFDWQSKNRMVISISDMSRKIMTLLNMQICLKSLKQTCTFSGATLVKYHKLSGKLKIINLFSLKSAY